MKIKKVLLFALGLVLCTTSLFSLELGIGFLTTANYSATKKASYAIDYLSSKNDAAFVNYEFLINNEDGKAINSRSYFRDEYGIETQSVMLVTSLYSYSKLFYEGLETTCDDKPYNIDSTLSMTNLTFCFDFKCVLTKTTLAKKKIGISESLAKAILGKDESDNINEDDLITLSSKTVNVESNNFSYECTIYCYYKDESKKSYFKRYLHGNFIVFHETEIAPSTYSNILTATSYSDRAYKVLKKVRYLKNNFDISLIDKESNYILLNDKIVEYINGLNNRNQAWICPLLLIIGCGLYASFFFLKLKRRYIVLLSSVLIVDFVKFIILRTTISSLLIISLNTYFSYLILIACVGLLLIKKKYKNE